MTLIKTAAGCLAASFFCFAAQAQHPVGKNKPQGRWILSFNPLGLIEPPAAIGFGAGYRLNQRVELWSETSFITNGFFQTEGPLTGIRQLLQTKYFIDRDGGFFVAAEVRYKSYQYRDKLNFYNPDLHDSLINFSNFSRHYFFGIGVQVGWRTCLSNDGRLQLELTTGLGFRIGRVVRQDVPHGYSYKDFYPPKDYRIINLADGFPSYYLPGSLRVICLFGKRLRP